MSQASTARNRGGYTEEARSALINRLLDRGFPLMSFPKELEAEFQQSGHEARKAHLIHSGALGLLMFNLFLITDYFIVPEVFGWALLLRTGIFTPLSLALLWAFHWRKFKVLNELPPRTVELMAMSTGLLSSGVLGLILYISTSPYAYLHHIAFMALFAYGNIVQRLRFWMAAAFTACSLIMHVAGVLWLSTFPSAMVLPIFAMVLSTGLFTLTVTYFVEKDERTRFLLTERERGLIRSLSHMQVRLRDLARIDDLTQLHNRRHFEEVVMQMWQRASFNQTNMSIMMIDLDHFKKYNDHYGHPAGDACIRQACDAMKRYLNVPGVALARYGGEEFIAAIPDLSQDRVLDLAESVRAGIAGLRIEHAASPVCEVVTATIGVSTCVASSEVRLERLMSLADEALYDAKQGGRNAVQLRIWAPGCDPVHEEMPDSDFGETAPEKEESAEPVNVVA